MLVGISGRKRSGKDTSARALVKALGFTRIGFADKLKTLSAEYLELPLAAVMSDEFKVEIVGVGADGAPLKGRDVFKKLGTAARKAFGGTFWIDQVIAQLGPSAHSFVSQPGDTRCDSTANLAMARCGELAIAHRNIVIADVRFWNELAAVKRAGGVVVRLNRNDCEQAHKFDRPEGFEFAANNLGACPVLCSVPVRLAEHPAAQFAACGLPRESHPTHYTGDLHASETELPDSGDCYDLVVVTGAADDTAESVTAWVKRLDKLAKG